MGFTMKSARDEKEKEKEQRKKLEVTQKERINWTFG